MTKRGITCCLLTLMMAVYLVIAVCVSNSMAAKAPCRGVDISVIRNDMSRFVTADDVDHELGGIRARVDSMAASEVDLDAIERRLGEVDNIEKVNCYRRNDDRIAIDVTPMVPVARVFDRDRSYYINRDGKRLTANARYQVDAPVIIGRFDSVNNPVILVPLIERVSSEKVWNELVEAFVVADNGDIIIIPSINGHVINFGDVSMVDSKFRRLTEFYRQVMPVKGWNYYDTVSVKFAGQIVASIAPGKRRGHENIYKDEDFIEENDVNSMMTDNIGVNEIKPKI